MRRLIAAVLGRVVVPGIAALAIAAPWAGAQAKGSTTLRCAADATIAEDPDPWNRGGEKVLRIGGRPAARALLRFDLPGLEASGEITGAVLVLSVAAAPGKDLEVALLPLGQAFDEGRAAWMGVPPGGTTWLEAASGRRWREPGGDFDAAVSYPVTVTAGAREIRVDIRHLVRQLRSGGRPNHGFVITARDGERLEVVVHSREAGESIAPRIELQYGDGAVPDHDGCRPWDRRGSPVAAPAPRAERPPGAKPGPPSALPGPGPAASRSGVEPLSEPVVDGRSFRIPLEVRNPSPHPRSNWPVTSGIPFPAGMLRVGEGVRVLGPEGQPVPLQTRVLGHWDLIDGSVRWLLLDFQVDVPPHGRVVCTLEGGAPAPVPHPLTIEERPEGLRVVTGPLEVLLDRRAFRLFGRVALDGDGDGSFTDPEVLVAPRDGDPDGLSIVSDEQAMIRIAGTFKPWGSEYRREDPGITYAKKVYSGHRRPLRTLEVEEAGPLRAVILARGTNHSADDAGAVPGGLYDFSARLTFWAGQPCVAVELALENTSSARWLQPQKGLWLVSDWAVATTLAGESGAPEVTLGLERPTDPGLPGGREALFRAADAASPWLTTTGALVAWQASAGSSQWDRERQWLGAIQQGGRSPAPFRGFKVWREPGDGVPLATGDRLDGWIDVNADRGGFTAGIRDLAMRHPKALEVAGRTVRVNLLPGRQPHHWHVDFGERLTNEILYAFHGPEVVPADRRATWESLNRPLFARAPASWYAGSLAMAGDVASIAAADIDRTHLSAEDADWFDLGVWGTQLQAGQRGFGGTSDYNSGGLHRQSTPVWQSFLATGFPVDLHRGLVETRTLADGISWLLPDVRPGRGRDALRSYLQAQMFGPKSFLAHREGFPKTLYDDTTWREGPVVLHAYKGIPDEEHCSNFQVLDGYHLLGSASLLEAVRALGDRCLAWNHYHLLTLPDPARAADVDEPEIYEPAPFRPLADLAWATDNPRFQSERGYISRVYGWAAHSLANAGAATGDRAYLDSAWWMLRKLALVMRASDGFVDAGGPRRVEGPWLDAVVILGLDAVYRLTRDEGVSDLVQGLATVLEDCSFYQKGRGLPHEFDPATGKVTTGEYEHHLYVAQALARAYVHSRSPGLRAMGEEFLAKAPWQSERGPRLDGWAQEALRVFRAAKPPSAPPVAVTDLRAERIEGRLRLTWTAPAAAGGGPVAAYQVKVSDLPIVMRSGRDRLRTHRSFWAADNVRGEPEPAAPGTGESFTFDAVHELSALGAPSGRPLAAWSSGRRFVALRARDPAGNLSALSNVVEF